MENTQPGLARKIHAEAEKYLPENEPLFKKYIDALPAAVYITDAEGKLTHYNQAAVEFSGYEPKLGTDEWWVTWKLYHEDGTPMPHDKCPMALALKEKRSITGKEAIAERPDGKRIWFELFPSPIFDDNGELIGGINLLIDISARKRSDLLLIEQNNLLELIASGAPLEDCLSSLCQVISKLNPDVRATILLLNDSGSGIQHFIAPDFPSSFSKIIEKVPVDETGSGTCVEAIRSGLPVCCPDVAADKQRSKEWRELCLSYKIYSCHSKSIYTNGRKPAGSLMLSFNKPYEPTGWELRLSDFGTYIASIAVERELSRRRLQKKTGQLSSKVTDLERLHSLSIQLMQQDDIEKALHEVMTASADLLQAEKASVQIYDEQENQLRLVSTKGFGKDFEERFQIVKPDDFTTCAAAIKQRRPILVKDLSSDDTFAEFRKASEPYGIRSALSTPLFSSNGNLLGMFTMYWLKPHHPSDNNLQLLDLYSQQSARQIERTRAEGTLRERENRLKEELEDSRLLQSLSSQFIEEDNVEVLYEKILEAAVAIMNSDFGSMQMLEQSGPNKNKLRLLTSRGFDVRAEKYWKWVTPQSSSVCGLAMKTGNRVIAQDVENDEFLAGTKDLAIYKQNGIRAVQSTPLFSRNGKMLGMISTHWSKPHEPSDRDLRMFDILARQAADLIEQKSTEATLSKSEERLKAVLDGSEAGAWELNLEDSTAWRSLRHDQIFGYESLLPEWSYEMFMEHVLREDREQVNQKFKAAMEKNKPWNFECRIKRTDEEIRWIWAQGKISRRNKDQPKRMLGTVLDITERKKSELNNALLGAVVEGSDDAIISKNLDGIITSWNKSAERLFGYTAGEAIGKSVTMLMPPGRIDEETKIIRKVRNGTRVQHFETVRQHKNGTLLDVSLTISPVQDSSGNIIGASKIARDITRQKIRRKERENLLRKEKTERRLLAEIFKNSPSFMCILRGPDHVFERANDLFFKLIGNREVIGKPVREALPEIKGQGFFELLDHAYQTGEVFNGHDMEVSLNRRTENGKTEKRYVDFVYQPLRTPTGEVSGIFVQGIDLTERKRAKEELQAVNATLEERVKERTTALLSYQEQLRKLASALSKAEENERQRLATELHDNLGQTLAIGKMKLDLLQKTSDPAKAETDIAELADLMNESIRYTRELMSDLKPPPSLNKENLKEAVAWICGKMKKFDLQVAVSDDEQPKPLSKEVRTTLCQCIRELLFNVVKHAEIHKAHVTLLRQEDQVKVTVEDNGAGFDPNEEKMAPTNEGRFGLFNIMERMDLLGGSLEIESSPGQGTKAILVAPLKRGKTEHNLPVTSAVNGKTAVAQPVEVPAENSNSKISVLLVDDHQMMREGLRKIIEDEDDLHIIAEAADGNEAVKLSLEKSPDVIVMDINMPGMDGIQATKKIMSECQNIRIIGLSLHDNRNVANAMKRAGASAYLTKTEAFETLCATIRSEALILNSKTS